MALYENETNWRKFPQFLKISWMIFWRISVIGVLIGFPELGSLPLAIIGAWFVVYGLGYSIRTWPILKAIKNRGKTFFGAPYAVILKLWDGLITTSTPKAPTARASSHSPATEDLGSTLEDLLNTGLMPENPTKGWAKFNQIPLDATIENRSETVGDDSPYTPYYLKKVSLKPTARVHGSPGAGLSDSGFEDSNIKAGQQGELNFAKALQEEELLDSFESYWSVALPDEDLFQEDETDIDCVLVGEDAILLIDLKSYKQGNLTYYNDGDQVFAVDNTNGNYIGKPHKTYPQMERGAKAFQSYLKAKNIRKKVIPMVILMPTDRGAGLVDCYWPGGVKAYSLEDGLKVVRGEAKGEPLKNARERLMGSRLEGLLKD